MFLGQEILAAFLVPSHGVQSHAWFETCITLISFRTPSPDPSLPFLPPSISFSRTQTQSAGSPLSLALDQVAPCIWNFIIIHPHPPGLSLNVWCLLLSSTFQSDRFDQLAFLHPLNTCLWPCITLLHWVQKPPPPSLTLRAGVFPYSSPCLGLSTVPAREKGLINICGRNVWKSGTVFGTV